MSSWKRRLILGMDWIHKERRRDMSEKAKRGIILAISTLLKGGMESDKIVYYIHSTYSLNCDEAEQLVSLAQTRLHFT